MKDKKSKVNKKIIYIIFLIIAIALIIIGIVMLVKNITKNRFKNILSENDSSNYMLIQTEDDEVITVYVYGTTMITESDDNVIWISESENMRVIIDKNYETAIVTKNPDESLTVGTLNSTYIENYFENSNEKFKYIGEEDGIYEIQFTNKTTNIVTSLFINKETGIVEKMIENFGESETVIEFEVTLNCVSSEDVEVPNLDGIYTEYSSNSNVEGSSADYLDEEENEETSDGDIIIIETEE